MNTADGKVSDWVVVTAFRDVAVRNHNDTLVDQLLTISVPLPQQEAEKVASGLNEGWRDICKQEEIAACDGVGSGSTTEVQGWKGFIAYAKQLVPVDRLES